MEEQVPAATVHQRKLEVSRKPYLEGASKHHHNTLLSEVCSMLPPYC